MTQFISNPFSGDNYGSQNAITGYKQQLKAQGMNTDFYVDFGKGFVPGSPEPAPIEPCYLTFTANENDSSVGFAQFYNDTPVEYNIQCKKTGDSDWTDYTVGSNDDDNVVIIELDEGESVMFKGINPNGFYNTGTDEGMYCVIDGNVAASGDITSIINGVGGDCALPEGCFSSFFVGCEGLTTAPALPATTLASNCYQDMFNRGASLTTAPALPATTLANSCYYGMFSGCTTLTTAPALPATTLTNSCYYGMFYGCEGLTTAPALPATTLADYCYSGMFEGCTGLTTAPTLPATTLANNCYDGMFYGCTGLTTAPELPATTLTMNCYQDMFSGCTGLEHVEAMFLTNPEVVISDGKVHYEYPYTLSWLNNVAQEGTFITNADATWVEDLVHRNEDTIPSGWTIQTAS